MNDRERVEALVSLARSWTIPPPDLKWVDPPVLLQKEHAINATIMYFGGGLSEADARSWASWILSRPDVLVDGSDELLEFLTDWAEPSVPMDAESVDVWQSRLARD